MATSAAIVPKDLANRIANNLPEEIPKVNFDNFLKMRAKEAPQEKSTAEQIGDKLDEKADEVLADFGCRRNTGRTSRTPSGSVLVA